MINPNRTIDEDHRPTARLRGIARNAGSLPPSRANRRALSRSISARNASRGKAGFSVRPDRSCAWAKSSSSNATVVRIIHSTARDRATRNIGIT